MTVAAGVPQGDCATCSSPATPACMPTARLGAETALVAEYGFWVIAMEYMLTKEGMFCTGSSGDRAEVVDAQPSPFIAARTSTNRHAPRSSAQDRRAKSA